MKNPAAPRLCVVTAASIEFKTVAKLLPETKRIVVGGLPACQGRYGRSEITLLQSAIGAPGFSSPLQQHVIACRYDALIVIGLAGALAPALKTGEIVIYDRCLDARPVERELPRLISSNREISFPCDEFASIPCDATVGEQVFEFIRQSNLRCQRGTGALVEQVITESQAKAFLYQQTQAIAVDMETWHVLKVLTSVPALPCVAVRVISDEAGSDLPDFNAGLSVTGQMRLWPTVRALAAHPRASAEFLFNLQLALRSLKQAAEAVFTTFNSR